MPLQDDIAEQRARVAALKARQREDRKHPLKDPVKLAQMIEAAEAYLAELEAIAARRPVRTPHRGSIAPEDRTKQLRRRVTASW